MRTSHRFRSAAAVALLVALPALFFWQPLFTDRVLLPLDNVYEFAPWRQMAAAVGVDRPHNSLLSDLVLQNRVWKQFLVDAIREGRVPLWNPHLFAGVPFLAAGQHSALYPTTLLFLLMPLERAYGFVAFLNSVMTALFTYLYCTSIGMRRIGRLIAAITFTFCGFAVVSVVFPMVGSVFLWLPLLLTIIELAIQRLEVKADNPAPERRLRFELPLLVAAGSLVVAMQFLAGHVEISYYVLLTTALYTLVRLIIAGFSCRPSLKTLTGTATALAIMVLLGLATAGVQLIPMYEFVTRSFREGSASYEQVISWAYPTRQILTFFIPDFFGNPSHHAYRSVFDWQVHQVSTNYLGGQAESTWWGIKNYVEAGAYLGVLPLVLAVVGLGLVRNRYTWTFAGLGLLSLLFVFGTPAYWLPYHLLPGFTQLHSPFRWVLLYSFCVSILAGWGASLIVERFFHRDSSFVKETRFIGSLAVLCTTFGMLGLVALGLSLAARERVAAIAEQAVLQTPRLQEVFDSGRALYSYQFWNLLAFFVFLLLSGAVLCVPWFATRSCRLTHLGALFPGLATLLVVADLFYFGIGFNTAADPSLGKHVPPAVSYLAEHEQPYRITSFGREKTFWPNLPMLYGISDIRGYDSIIPQQYVSLMEALEHQGLLEHNRIAPLSREASLASPLLSLLNVEYLVAEETVEHSDWELVYHDDLLIYRHRDPLPRAYYVTEARAVPNEAEALALVASPSFDPRRQVILLESEFDSDHVRTASAASALAQVEILSYRANDVALRVVAPGPGFLVLGDSYFPGWRAQVNGSEAKVYRANYNFRAVLVSSGESLVEFKYSPLSFRLGLFSSLVGSVIIGLIVAHWAWQRSRQLIGGAGTASRVARNSLTPMATSLINKAIDVAFAMLLLRLLGPENVGKYAFAVVMIGYFEIFTNFGLNTLLIRDVARDRRLASTYLVNTATLRLLLCGVSAPLLGGLVAFWWWAFDLSPDVILVIALLSVSLIPGNVSAALSSLFYAEERMEYPAGVSVLSTVVKVVLGVTVLLLGWGIVGLASVSVLVNVVTMSVFAYLVWTRLLRPRFEVSRKRMMDMLSTSLPLMLNHLLATVFFRVDVLLLQPIQGDRAVGYYSTAYKFIDGLNIIPSTFTFAVFPLLSRYAESARESLQYAYTLSLRLLVGISLPIAIGTVFLAEPIILFFGGEQYVPHSVLALQVLIWFLPFSYVNSITQYVLIAVNQQRFITLSFLVATTFNVVANLILIPRYGYVGCGVATVLSEIVLLAPFLFAVSRHVGSLSSLNQVWQPVVGAAAMVAVFLYADDSERLLIAPLATVAYLAVTAVLTSFNRSDRDLAKRLLGRDRPPTQPADAAFSEGSG